ncbi:MAG TPA: GNAT family N-acetyltransferase [Thermoanaerobaculia bacterium]|nr:GNAT family N-acetyltransferase [Thermoanaerobaculia bacterium]
MIRKAVAADLPEIERVMRASMAALSEGFYDAAQAASAVRYIAAPDRQLVDDGTYFVVEEDGRIVACGGWSRRKKLFTGTSAQEGVQGLLDPATDAARIRAMFVEPAYARRGLGRLILDASERDAYREGFRTFELMATLPGVPLYAACGYEEIERTTIELPDGMRLGTVLMRRCVK